MWLPFFFLLVGFVLAAKINKWADPAIKVGLTLLLLGMGISTGADEKLMRAIPRLGFESVLFCLCSSLLSIALLVGWEKLFLKGYSYAHAQAKDNNAADEVKFIILVMICLAFGIVVGSQTNIIPARVSNFIIDVALVCIYISIGVSMRFAIRKLPRKIGAYYAFAFIPILVTVGSVGGGLLAGLLSGENLRYSTAIGGGMAYYSLAAAMITSAAGLKIGLIALISNFMREVLTFILTPFLARYSNLAPIALGGASTMDTTLVVMKQSLNEKYTLVAFFNGLALSFIVPALLLLILGTSW